MFDSVVHHRRTTCRACGGHSLTLVLALGETPLANGFLRTPEQFASESSYPLDLYLCKDCWLVQLLDIINAEILFRDYIYVTGTSDTIAAHNVEYARTVRAQLALRRDELVVEVGSNDGSLLRCFNEGGSKTLGIEPASNIASLARRQGIETINRFFDRQCARAVRASHGKAKTVIANNVLGHVDDTEGFMRACRDLLHEDGLIVIEVPYLREMLDRLEYDTIYHEHLSYFSVMALLRLCELAGLSIVRADRIDVHGGSVRIYAGHAKKDGHAREVLAMACEEQAAGLTSMERYTQFRTDVERSRRKLVELLAMLKRDGRSVGGYGAPAKGNTLLNYCRIDAELLSFTVDKNSMKVGLFTPGTHIPILPVSALQERQPDYALILAWNFAEEIMKQQQGFCERGGRFIVPIPEPRIVGGGGEQVL